MLLSAYLTKNKLTQEQFAKKIKVNQSTISHYLSGRIPNPQTMRKIVKATNGLVQPTDFYNLDNAK